jgi:CubicO group peptidase (beta-lactamase class C family)
MRSSVALLAALFAAACVDDAVWPELDAPAIPEQRDDGWEVSSPAEQGLDPQVLALLEREILEGDLEEIHTLLIARNGVLVYEGYYYPTDSLEKLHQLNSATKTVASMLVGAAQQWGLLQSFGQPVHDIFPEHSDLFDADPRKRSITLRHVLTMSSGLAWDDEHPSVQERDGRYVREAPDAVRYVLGKEISADPGTRFLYSGGNSLLLSAVVRNVSGLEADVFAQEALFGPLGITEHRWLHIEDGLADADGGLFMRGRDLAKLGQLFLQEGRWNGAQILSTEWVSEAGRPWIDSDLRDTRYGYQFWLNSLPDDRGGDDPAGIIQASGYGGQKLFIVPEHDLVVVFFGCSQNTYECGISDSVPSLALYNYILRALQ